MNTNKLTEELRRRAIVIEQIKRAQETQQWMNPRDLEADGETPRDYREPQEK